MPAKDIYEFSNTMLLWNASDTAAPTVILTSLGSSLSPSLAIAVTGLRYGKTE